MMLNSFKIGTLCQIFLKIREKAHFPWRNLGRHYTSATLPLIHSFESVQASYQRLSKIQAQTKSTLKLKIFEEREQSYKNSTSKCLNQQSKIILVHFMSQMATGIRVLQDNWLVTFCRHVSSNKWLSKFKQLSYEINSSKNQLREKKKKKKKRDVLKLNGPRLV